MALVFYACWLAKYQDSEPQLADAFYKYWDAQVREGIKDQQKGLNRFGFRVNMIKRSYDDRSYSNGSPFCKWWISERDLPLTITYTSVVGNLLVVGCYSFSATATFAISDSASQVWNAGSVVTNGSVRIQFFYMPNSAQITWVTCTITNSSGTPSFALAEFSGIWKF